MLQKRNEQKTRKFEGYGADVFIQFSEFLGGKVTSAKVIDKETIEITMNDVEMVDVTMNTYYEGIDSEALISCKKVVFTLTDFDEATAYGYDFERVFGRIKKGKLPTFELCPDREGFTVTCGGGYSHKSLADGFNGQLWDGRAISWNGVLSDVSALIGTVDSEQECDAQLVCKVSSVYIDAGNALEEYYDFMISSQEELDENAYEHCGKRNARRHFESSGKWMRSIDDFYALDFMDGNNSGYYSPDKSSDYCFIECFIDEDEGCFCVCYEDIEVDAIVDDFFNTVHLDRNPVRRKGIREFTDEDIQEFVANCIESGDYSHTDGDPEIIWSERDNSWAYDDMIASLDACAREQAQKILDAERYACQLIMRGKLEMSRESVRRVRDVRTRNR